MKSMERVREEEEEKEERRVNLGLQEMFFTWIFGILLQQSVIY